MESFAPRDKRKERERKDRKDNEKVKGTEALKRQNSLIFKVKSQTVSKLYLYSDRDISENNYDKNNEGSYLSFVTNGEFYFNKKGSHFLFNKHYEIHVK